MNTVTLRAHFDGEQIRLDEPYDLPEDAPLLIMVLSPDVNGTGNEREDWMLLAEQALARAYGDDEPEYTLDMIKEPNPKYDGR
jgi:hypothetical protein